MQCDVGDWTYVEDGLPEFATPVYAACRAKDGSRENWVAEVPFFGVSWHGAENNWGIPIFDYPQYEVYAWMPVWWPEVPEERKHDSD